MEFKMEIDDFLGLVDVTDLPAVMKVIEESMSPEKKPTETSQEIHMNGTK